MKPDDIPTIFPNCPSYISKKKPNERSQKATSASRQKHVDEHQDKVKTLEELFEKIVKNSDLDKYVTIVQKENKLMFMGFSLNNIDQLITEYCVVIYNDLSFNLWLKDVCVNEKGLGLWKDGKVTCCNNVISFISMLKSMCSNSVVGIVEFCVHLLEGLLIDDESKARKFSFICEHLRLCSTPPNGRSYSSDLLTCSVLWENTSPSFYKQIISDGCLTLPSVRHIHRLTSAISVDTGLTESTIRYLNAHISKLEEREKVVSIVMDEIYTSKRAEYSRTSGKFYGLENQEATKTLFTIMIKVLLLNTMMSLQ